MHFSERGNDSEAEIRLQKATKSCWVSAVCLIPASLPQSFQPCLFPLGQVLEGQAGLVGYIFRLPYFCPATVVTAVPSARINISCQCWSRQKKKKLCWHDVILMRFEIFAEKVSRFVVFKLKRFKSVLTDCSYRSCRSSANTHLGLEFTLAFHHCLFLSLSK